MAQTSSARPYRGVQAGERQAERRRRLLTAGLDLLGSDQQDIAELTVRGVCSRAGLASRYFYESFADKDELIGAVFDWVVADLAASTEAAASAVPTREWNRTAMANIVRTVVDDPRVGRLLFSTQLANAVIARKRAESSALFAMLSGRYAGDALRRPADDRIKAGAHFAVGGVGQTISAWLADDVRLERDEMVDLLTSLLDEISDPGLYAAGNLRETAAGSRSASQDRAATTASW